jgi:hypothetical protein
MNCFSSCRPNSPQSNKHLYKFVVIQGVHHGKEPLCGLTFNQTGCKKGLASNRRSYFAEPKCHLLAHQPSRPRPRISSTNPNPILSPSSERIHA